MGYDLLDLSDIRNHDSLERLRGRSFLFGIGGQRCGSTWLASRLSAHPDVAFSEIKELQFFNSLTMATRFPGMSTRYKRLLEQFENQTPLPQKRKLLGRIDVLRRRVQMDQDPSEYFQYFADIVGDKAAFGEITPEYAFLTPETLTSLKSLDLNFKIIYVVRNPVDRYISALSYKKKYHPEFNIRKAVRGCLQNVNFVEHTLYHHTIDRYQSIFGTNSVLWLYYEDMLSEERHGNCMKKIAEFLNITDFQKVDIGKRINTTEKLPVGSRMRQAIARRFREVYVEMKKRSDGSLPVEWSAELSRLEG